VNHVFPNDPKAARTRRFLDIQDRVRYDHKQNEEGFLGLAFHLRHKQNGEFFVFYTSRKAKQTNVVSRFRAHKDDPNRADPATEEVILRNGQRSSHRAPREVPQPLGPAGDPDDGAEGRRPVREV
jgi:hypothetical protein